MVFKPKFVHDEVSGPSGESTLDPLISAEICKWSMLEVAAVADGLQKELRWSLRLPFHALQHKGTHPGAMSCLPTTLEADLMFSDRPLNNKMFG